MINTSHEMASVQVRLTGPSAGILGIFIGLVLVSFGLTLVLGLRGWRQRLIDRSFHRQYGLPGSLEDKEEFSQRATLIASAAGFGFVFFGFVFLALGIANF